jgi:hypothetical protein
VTSWTRKYWEILDHLYWSPHYLGLKSIPQKHWTIDGGRVSIPRMMTNPKARCTAVYAPAPTIGTSFDARKKCSRTSST